MMTIKDSIGHFFVEKFNVNDSFTLWQKRVNDLLVQRGLYKVLQRKKCKFKEMEDDDWKGIGMRAINTIHFYLVKSVLFNIMDEDLTLVLWEKVEETLHGKESCQQVIS